MFLRRSEPKGYLYHIFVKANGKTPLCGAIPEAFSSHDGPPTWTPLAQPYNKRLGWYHRICRDCDALDNRPAEIERPSIGPKGEIYPWTPEELRPTPLDIR